jgi:hypothetical protein
MLRKLIFADNIVKAFAFFVSLGFITSILAVVFAVKECKARETFEDKCEVACYPNTVYSTEHRRCVCNANVIYREIK